MNKKDSIFTKLYKFANNVGNAVDDNHSFNTMEFIENNLAKIFFLMFLGYGYIMLGYQYEDAIIKLGRLHDELEEARYTSIATWGELTGKNKPEIVRAKISENVQLITSDEPFYILK